MTYLVLALLIAITLGPSFLIARVQARAIKEWYPSLKKPRWNPPNWIFGPVWTVLYLSMAVAMWLVWQAEPANRLAWQLFLGQLLLNHSWSPIFFVWRRLGAALIVLLGLWLSVLATTVYFFTISVQAGQLMLPYLAWVSFAGLLNYRIWRDNPQERS